MVILRFSVVILCLFVVVSLGGHFVVIPCLFVVILHLLVVIIIFSHFASLWTFCALCSNFVSVYGDFFSYRGCLFRVPESVPGRHTTYRFLVLVEWALRWWWGRGQVNVWLCC